MNDMVLRGILQALQEIRDELKEMNETNKNPITANLAMIIDRESYDFNITHTERSKK